MATPLRFAVVGLGDIAQRAVLPAFAHAYTSITFHDGRALLTYYQYAEKTKQVSLKFKSVPLEWLSH